jgi:hypothetical protein
MSSAADFRAAISGMTPQAHHVAAAIDDERRLHPLPCPAIDHKINWVGYMMLVNHRRRAQHRSTRFTE